jgi:hypothetical protein
MHQNDVFFIFKNLILKLVHQNNLKYIKKNKFFKTQIEQRFQIFTSWCKDKADRNDMQSPII